MSEEEKYAKLLASACRRLEREKVPLPKRVEAWWAEHQGLEVPEEDPAAFESVSELQRRMERMRARRDVWRDRARELGYEGDESP